ncbi:hypothetical protein IU449_28630 [Nocardia higoensis]|uniref:Uncharacterized protein n=1 Tax=Nocardia higoensis TaxID=228599 RepID=A0ABS0DJ38_9NOCA|nr:hypothetical protein [Nocardia higoensis]MBF6358467.1 hypothetical protein [Nocardia higoensis]
MSDEHDALSGPELPWFLVGQGYSAADAAAIVRALSDDGVRLDSHSVRAWLGQHGDKWSRTV